MFVITRLAVGGAPQSVLTCIGGLDPKEYRIVLVSGVPDKNEGDLMADARALNVPLHLISELRRAPHPVKDLKALWNLCCLMRGERVDIVHTHLSKAGILGRFAAYLCGVPAIVHTYHGDVLEGYFSKLKSWLYTRAERVVGRVTDRFVCVSEALKQRLLAYRLGLPEDFQVIPNGIDVHFTDSDSHPITVRPGVTHSCLRDAGTGVGAGFAPGERAVGRRVGTLAMFYPIKRLDLFVRMAHRLRETHADISFEIAGDGMEAEALHRLSESLGKPVAFGGICRDRRAFLNSLDIFVSCSDFEGAGMGVMEAMAAGVPVVATCVGGVAEIVQDGKTGVLLPPDDVDALCVAVGNLLSDAPLRKRMGRTARQYARAHFSEKKMIAELDAMYRALIQK